MRQILRPWWYIFSNHLQSTISKCTSFSYVPAGTFAIIYASHGNCYFLTSKCWSIHFSYLYTDQHLISRYTPKRIGKSSKQSTHIFTAAGFTGAIGGNNVSVHWWMMDKHNVVHLCSGILFRIRKDRDSGHLLQPGWTLRMWCSMREAVQKVGSDFTRVTLEESDPQRLGRGGRARGWGG